MTKFDALHRVLFRRIFIAVFILLNLNLSEVHGQYYGLYFAAHDYDLDQRSGLDLTPDGPLGVKEKLDLQFYLRFDPGHESYFGYVFRLLIGNQNIDLIHSIVPGNPNNFELIIGSKTSDVVFDIPIDTLLEDWSKFRFELDLKNKNIRCYYNDIQLANNLDGFEGKNEFRLMFGAHSWGSKSSTDVPPMIIRDVEIQSDGKNSYTWPLNETEGEIAHSSPKGNNGVASNPIWLLKRHSTWESILNLDFQGGAKTAFDPQNSELFILSNDSLYILNTIDYSLRTIPHSSPFAGEAPIGLLFNPVSRSLTRYSLDNQYISIFDAAKGLWSSHNPGNEWETAYWHHNHLITAEGSIMTLGGYGHYKYTNTVLKWNQEPGRFDSIKYEGEFRPRYLAGAGYNPSDSLYYIIGGYGSESGKQAESPGYYYEILSYSPSDFTFSRVHEFSNMQAGFCFANSLVFDDDNNLYALYFPKDDGDNQLQLIKVSLDKPEILELGDPIEYSFLDVKAYADLFYSKANNSLVAVNSYTDDNRSKVSVHSIAFPPQEFTFSETESEKTGLRILPFMVAGIILLLSAMVLYFNRQRKKPSTQKAVEKNREFSKAVKKENSIILFGGFQVFDRDGNDITGQFTPLPKKLFLFILLHSLKNNKGVSSAVLYETFWFDKSVESARNNRAVNIVKLKSLLDHLDSASISKDTGYWKFNFDPKLIQIDYYQYLEIIRQKGDLNREDVVGLLSLIENKTFLNNTQADWLDSFKSEISNEIIDIFIRYISDSKDDPEFLLHLTNCIFLFDAVSEEALKVQCRMLIKQGKHSLAKNSYSKFTKEYKHLYDEEYGLSFSQVIGEKPQPE